MWIIWHFLRWHNRFDILNLKSFFLHHKPWTISFLHSKKNRKHIPLQPHSQNTIHSNYFSKFHLWLWNQKERVYPMIKLYWPIEKVDIVSMWLVSYIFELEVSIEWEWLGILVEMSLSWMLLRTLPFSLYFVVSKYLWGSSWGKQETLFVCDYSDRRFVLSSTAMIHTFLQMYLSLSRTYLF